MSDTYRVVYEVTGEVKKGAGMFTNRKTLTDSEGHLITAVNLRYTRQQGMEDDEAIRRILAIVYPFGDIEPEQVVIHEKEEI